MSKLRRRIVPRLLAIALAIGLGAGGNLSAQSTSPEPKPAPAVAAEGKPAAAAVPADAPEPDPWPRVLEGAKYTFEVYPPQVESWNGTELRAISAVAVSEKGSKEKHAFGALEFTARTRVDREARMVTVDQLKVQKATFPSAPQQEAEFGGFVSSRFADKVKVVALDRLETALAASTARAAAESKPVRNDPPAIRIVNRPAMLIFVDGEPVWKPVKDSTFQRLINTRPLLLRASDGGVYLRLFDGWMRSAGVNGPWSVAPAPPGLDAAMKATVAVQPGDLLEGGGSEETEVGEDGKPIPKPTLAKGPIPDIFVATEPAELIVTDGEPKWTAIPTTTLEYVENTTGNIFRSGVTHYVLLSGRWFSAPSFEGPWQFVSQKMLAADFKKIPDDSPKENAKASVAGTPQADEAIIANSIPETAVVERKNPKFEARYDGEPKFVPIEGTRMTYSVNSPEPVINVGPEWYAVSNGVWFVASAATGPFAVAAKVPSEIYTIPTNSPLHYVTYVRVYGSTDEVVEVGYTPGYYGTVVADEVVVYGTGYYYTPWIGSYWYGYPVTYGYGSGITYTPWAGWAFTFGVGFAWGYWGGWYAPYGYPYWGPYYGYGYYPYYGGAIVGSGGGWAVWGPGGWAGTTGNIYRQAGNVSSVSRYSGGFDAWSGTAWRGQVGAAYNSRTGTVAAGQRGAVGNVYTGEYAYGGRGVARNTNTGTTVAGGRVTMGDADTGRQVTAGRAGAYNPNTGQGGTAGWVRGEQGGVARVGDDFYAGKDGQVYKRGDDGSWSQVERGGRGQNVSDTSRTRDLNRQSQARDMGSQRYSGNRHSSPSFGRMGGGMRGGGGRRR